MNEERFADLCIKLKVNPDARVFRAINYLERHGKVFGGEYGVLNATDRARELRRERRVSGAAEGRE